MNTPTDNAWLDELMEFDIWCMCGADECVLYQNYKEAKAKILTHIDTVCREAVVAELAKIRDIEGVTVDAWASPAHQHILDRLTQLNPNKDTLNGVTK